jgi:phospholipase C
VRAARDSRSKAAPGLAVLLAVAVSFWACSARQPATIEHTVIILQENHTFDNYFGTYSGADGVTSGLTCTGLMVPLTPLPDMDFAPSALRCTVPAFRTIFLP